MKPVRKFIGIFIASWFALLASSSTVFANSTIQKVIDQKYSQPDYVIGSSLDEFQVEQTISLLMYNEEIDKEWKTMDPSAIQALRLMRMEIIIPPLNYRNKPRKRPLACTLSLLKI